MRLNHDSIIQSRRSQMLLKGTGAFVAEWFARCVIAVMTLGLILPSCQWLPEVAEVELSLYAVDVQVGTTTTINANVLPKAADYERIIWESSDPTVVGVTNGRLSGLKIGTAKVTASAEGVTSTPCVVTVKPINVTGVKLDKSSVEITEGETFSLSATISPANATDQSVKWGTGAAGVAMVSDDGLVTAVAPGKTAITVTTNDGGKTASCEVTVKAKVIPVTSVSVSPSTLQLFEGESGTLEPLVLPENATEKSVSWSTSNASVATVSSSGVVTAKTAGTAMITVTTEDGSKTSICEVTVKAKVIPVTGVSLDQSTLSLTEGESVQLKATVSPSNATNKDVTWTSSNTSVATVSADGVVTAKKAGTATITVKTKDGEKTATCKVTVKSKVIPVTGVSLSSTSLSMTVGETSRLTATVSPSNATNKEVTWSSNKTSVATVSSNGTVTAKASGTTTITVTTADGNNTATCSVTVRNATISVTGVSVSPKSLSLSVGQTSRLSANVSPSNATNTSVSWSSNNTSVATVASDGTVTAKAAGYASITCTTQDGSKKASCEVTVKTLHLTISNSSSGLLFLPYVYKRHIGKNLDSKDEKWILQGEFFKCSFTVDYNVSPTYFTFDNSYVYDFILQDAQFSMTPRFQSCDNGVLSVVAVVEGQVASGSTWFALRASKNGESYTSGFIPANEIGRIFSIRATGWGKTGSEWDISSLSSRWTSGDNLEQLWASCDTSVHYSGSLDLKTIITVKKANESTPNNAVDMTYEEIEDAGLSLVFELVKNYRVGSPATDQANYATLSGSVFCPRGGDDAIGHAPIVRVKLMHDGDVVEVGYIKIFIAR